MLLDSADAATLHLLEAAYDPMRSSEERTPNVHVNVVRCLDGRLRVKFGGSNLRLAGGGSATDPFLSAFYTTREIFARFAAITPNAHALYGATVAVNGAAMLILGPSTIGKTLLALHLAHRGAKFLGDESALLLPETAEVQAVPRRPALREPALLKLPNAAMRAAVETAPHVFRTERGRLWYALRPEDLHGVAPSPQPYPLRYICSIRRRDESFSMRQSAVATGLPAIVQRAYKRPTELLELASLHRALRHASYFEVDLGAPDESAERLLEGVTSCA